LTASKTNGINLMMISKRFAIAVTCLVLVAACNRGAEPEAVTPAADPSPADLPAAPDAGMAADAPMPIAAEEPFMMKAFAGTFSADGNTVTLNADGSYASRMGNTMSDGTWTADSRGSQLLLDPNSKAESDQTYAVVSKNEIRALYGGLSLQREGAAK